MTARSANGLSKYGNGVAGSTPITREVKISTKSVTRDRRGGQSSDVLSVEINNCCVNKLTNEYIYIMCICSYYDKKYMLYIKVLRLREVYFFVFLLCLYTYLYMYTYI